MKEQDDETELSAEELADEFGVATTLVRQARHVVATSRGLAEFFEQNRFALLGVSLFMERASEICRLASKKKGNSEFTVDDLFSYHRHQATND